jgi:tryptophan synthase alpha chain
MGLLAGLAVGGVCWREEEIDRAKKGFAPLGILAADSADMSRIAHAFANASARNRATFVAYLCAGDPDLETSLECCRALLRSGVDILELGVPFSDPLADGLVNQLAAQRALASGMTGAKVLELVRRVRAEFPAAAIVFYTYYNLVFANGVEASVKAAREAGVDGMLTLDLPPEEAGELREACCRQGMDTVFIVAPTTSEARLPLIAEATTGFIYYVSREGVTGMRDQMAGGIPEAMARIRRHTRLPVVVGFGVSRREHVAQVAAHADGVVVGSALVNVIAENLDRREEIGPKLSVAAAELLAGTARQHRRA